MAIDPQRLPLDPGFEQDPARGAALDPGQLSTAAVRRRFLDPGDWRVELRSDDRIVDDARQPASAAAVLIALVQRDDRLSVLFTERARHLQAHAGQISFPGGRVEDADRGPVDAALREAAEETGLPVARIEVLGQLPVYRTITRFEVTPVVGLIASPITLTLARDEVEDAFEVPLSFLMDPGNHQRRVASVQGVQRYVYAMPFHDGQRERFIWGATAAILRNLYGFLRG
jgi:8-oxo-dGTP pyrophosphatase MutT (NUDIX family)